MDASFRKDLVEAEAPPYQKIKKCVPVKDCQVEFVEPGQEYICNCKPEDNDPCGEDSNCLNRMMMLECTPTVCPAKKRCRNVRFQNREYRKVTVVRADNGCGWGLKATEDIKKGDFIIEYVGELINIEEYRSRMQINLKTQEENYYYLTIDAYRMIDALYKGNEARFMNHSCEPNADTQKWTINGDTRVGLFANKDISAGTELTFNYQREAVGDTKKKCMCGASNCSGFVLLE